MKNRLFFVLATLTTWGYGQDTTGLATKPLSPVTYTAKNAWHISAFIPSLSYERRIGPQLTLVGEYGLGYIFANQAKSSGILSKELRMNSKASIGIRRYYDFERRVQQGRSIRYNSSGYVMLKLGYHFAPFDQGGDVNFNPGKGPFLQGLWGFQRTYRSNLYLNLAAGPQLWYPGISFGLDASIGYTLPTR